MSELNYLVANKDLYVINKDVYMKRTNKMIILKSIIKNSEGITIENKEYIVDISKIEYIHHTKNSIDIYYKNDTGPPILKFQVTYTHQKTRTDIHNLIVNLITEDVKIE